MVVLNMGSKLEFRQKSIETGMANFRKISYLLVLFQYLKEEKDCYMWVL